MITVSILINGKPLFTRSAIRRQELTGDTGGLCYRYELDDGSTLDHYYNDGAIPLAIEMLKTIKEPR